MHRPQTLGYAIDAGPLWIAQYLGAGHVVAALAPVYVLRIGVFDARTGKPDALMDLPDAADLALHWVPGICVWVLVQALAIDLLGASMGALAAGLKVARTDGAAPTRARLLARELLRAAPAACAMIVAAVLVELDAHTASFWVLAGGFALAVATASRNGVASLYGARSLLDIAVGTCVRPGRDATGRAQPYPSPSA